MTLAFARHPDLIAKDKVRTPAGSKKYGLPIGATIRSRRTMGEAIKHTKSGGRLLRRLRDVGGFTVVPADDVDVGEGFSVAVAPTASLHKPLDDLKPSDVDKWLREHAAAFTTPGTMIGGWHDTSTGEAWLDIVEVLPDRDKAIELGKKHNQIAIFDLGTGTEIDTGGTGMAKAGSPIRLYLFKPTATGEEIVRAMGGDVPGGEKTAKYDRPVLSFARYPDLLDKRAPRDADNDNLIYEGTPRERPAGPKTPKINVPRGRGGRKGKPGAKPRTTTPLRDRPLGRKRGAPDGKKTIRTSNVAVAARALADGHNVELRQVKQVSTLLDELAALVADAKAKGEDAPVYDLCKVTVKGTSLFCVESKGIPRVQMPQLSGKPKPGSKGSRLKANEKGEIDLSDQFREHLLDKGYTVSDEKEKAANLKASQNELNGAKVAGMAKALDEGKLPPGAIYVSGDNYVIDGHHRWAANVGHDAKDGKVGDLDMDVIRVGLDVITLLKEANDFADLWGIPQAGVGQMQTGGEPTVTKVLKGFRFPDLVPCCADCGGGVKKEYGEWKRIGRKKCSCKNYTGSERNAHGDQVCERCGGTVMAKVSSRAYPDLERVPGKQNWVDHAGGLPSYIERIAKHLHYEKGMTIGHAIATAVNQCKKWAAGGGNVNPDTRARAAKAIAQWEAKKVKSKVGKDDAVELAEGNVMKFDAEKRLVFGWAYVTHDPSGVLNVDKSGEYVDEAEEIEDAAYGFVLKSRTGDIDHTNVQTSTLVESIVFTPEKVEKMGLPPGTMPTGWWVGFKVHDDDVWANRDRYTSFSIYGSAKKEAAV